ncbi:MAG: electron transfer flavoprotein subunit alpha/FixB family protein [Cellulomonadaceae bacterium]|jgi:electron transfer flavoprotein alpha subunit|nr:electron transfer flavoprotein subunit alpha/FixB family protein [Cellulomonadaceae bacterium]
MSTPAVLVQLDSTPSPDGPRVDAVRPVTAELITLGRTLGHVDVFTMGSPSVEALAALGALGVRTVHQAQLPTSLPVDAHRTTNSIAAIAVTVAQRIHADVLLCPTGFAAKEIAAVAAARLGAGLVTDATSLTWAGGEGDGKKVLRATKHSFGGAWNGTVDIITDPAVVTVASGAVTVEPAATPTHPEVEAVIVDPPAPKVTVLSREVKPRASDRPSLEEAAAVVAGGRGTGGDFTDVYALADALDAAVGATRDIVHDGHFDRFIGQTGVTIAPALYVAAGISGAPHHVAGIQGAGHIISIVNDPEAPIVELSNLAVLGDVAAVLPATVAAVTEAKKAAGSA